MYLNQYTQNPKIRTHSKRNSGQVWIERPEYFLQWLVLGWK